MSRAYIPDGSPEWRAARCGAWTASRAADLMSRNKKDGTPLKKCDDLLLEIAIERVTGEPFEKIETAIMRRGKEHEPDAIERFELQTGEMVRPAGYMRHPSIATAGASPDGELDSNEGLEAKCPFNMAKHTAALVEGRGGDGILARLADVSPLKEYWHQCNWQAWVCGFERVKLISYDPRFPVSKQLAVLTVEPDKALFDQYAEAVAWADAEVAQIMNKLEAA